MKDHYIAPAIVHLGTVRDLTKQTFNKIGPESDSLTPIAPLIVGSFVPT